MPSEIGGKKVTASGDFTFSECGSLEKVHLPCTLVTIGELAFEELCFASRD